MTACLGLSLEGAALAEGFCAFEYPVQVAGARMIHTVGASDAVILERGIGSVTLLQDLNRDGVPETKRILASAPSLNHGLALRDGYIYASSDTTLYRWQYTGYFDIVDAEPVVIINNINPDGRGGAPQGHRTRTPIFDDSGRLYLSIGSVGNVDPDSFRSRIRRFDISDETTYPIDFLTGEVFADGLRNEVGMVFDRHGVLWGVENGADRLQRNDLGIGIFNDNPAEELHRFPEEMAGAHFGYPFCWTEYLLPPGTAKGRGTAWAWPATFPSGPYTDEICNDSARFAKSALAMQAHSAPLGITFYDYSTETVAECAGVEPFPEWMNGYAFIPFHGSWNRDIPTGYKVVYVPMSAMGMVTGEPVDLLAHIAPNARWEDGFRPVDAAFDACGRLVVTSDGTRGRGSKVVRIDYQGGITAGTLPTSSPSTAVPSVSSVNPSPNPTTGTTPANTSPDPETTPTPSTANTETMDGVSNVAQVTTSRAAGFTFAWGILAALVSFVAYYSM